MSNTLRFTGYNTSGQPVEVPVAVSDSGAASVTVSGALVSHFWAGTGTTNAPATNVVSGQIGVNNDGATTANVYHYNGTAWVDTGATVLNLYGG